MSVVGLVLCPCASLVLFQMSNVSFKISLKCVDKPRVYVIPLYISSISDILIVAMDERSPRSGGRLSRFPASRLFLSSAYQRRLCFHPQAGSSSILSMNLKSYNMFFFFKKKDPSRQERPILHQDPHRTAKSGAGGCETPRRRWYRRTRLSRSYIRGTNDTRGFDQGRSKSASR